MLDPGKPTISSCDSSIRIAQAHNHRLRVLSFFLFPAVSSGYIIRGPLWLFSSILDSKLSSHVLQKLEQPVTGVSLFDKPPFLMRFCVNDSVLSPSIIMHHDIISIYWRLA
jgi:hypothetical protein